VYRIAFIGVILLAVFLGLLVGTLNSDRVLLDLLWVQIEWPLGLVLLMAGAAGLLLGLLLTWLFSVLPLKARLRKASRAAHSHPETGALQKPDD